MTNRLFPRGIPTAVYVSKKNESRGQMLVYNKDLKKEEKAEEKEEKKREVTIEKKVEEKIVEK